MFMTLGALALHDGREGSLWPFGGKMMQLYHRSYLNRISRRRCDLQLQVAAVKLGANHLMQESNICTYLSAKHVVCSDHELTNRTGADGGLI